MCILWRQLYAKSQEFLLLLAFGKKIEEHLIGQIQVEMELLPGEDPILGRPNRVQTQTRRIHGFLLKEEAT